MYQLDNDGIFGTFLIIATGLILAQNSFYGLYIYLILITFVGLLTWGFEKLGWFDDL